MFFNHNVCEASKSRILYCGKMKAASFEAALCGERWLEAITPWGLDFPLAAVVAGEPLVVTATDELVLGGVPFDVGSMPVAEVHEVA